MKLPQNTAVLTGNFAFKKKIKMGISAKAMGAVIDHLISQYQEPLRAVIREYSSNARDAHTVAGQTRPIEVTLPTTMDPNLVIRDWGVGMTADDMEIYGQFGESNKDDSNDEIGGYGYGSKSGLSIASSFTVTSIKDGIKNIGIVHRGEHGEPAIGMLDPQETTEPNGTTITIPSSDINRATDIAHDMYVGWERGTVLVNGEEPRYSVYDTQTFTALDNNLGWRVSDLAAYKLPTTDYIGIAAINGVTVPLVWKEIDPELHHRLREGLLKKTVFNIENGSVELHRSREGLIYTPQTVATLKGKLDELLNESRVEYQTKITAAATSREAWHAKSKAEFVGFKGDYKFKNTKLEFDKKKIETLDPAYLYLTQAEYNGDKIERTSRTIKDSGIESTILTESAVAVLVTGSRSPERTGRYTYYSTPKMLHPESRTATTFIRQYAIDKTISDRTVNVYFTSLPDKEAKSLFAGIFTEVITSEDYADTLKTARKAAAAEARLSRPVATKDKTKVTARVMTYQSGGQSYWTDTTLDQLDTTKEYILLKADDEATLAGKLFRGLTTKAGYNERVTLTSYFAKYVVLPQQYVVLLALKSWDTSKYADSITLVTPEEALQRVLDANKPDFTEVELMALHSHKAYWATRMGDKHRDEILDEELKGWIAALADESLADRHQKYTEVSKIASVFGLTAPAQATYTVPETTPMDRYPMLDIIDGYGRHNNKIVEYINTVYLFNL